MTGYQSKKAVALDRDAEIERLNEKIEFLARTNMLYSDWEHRNVKVTSDLIRKGIEEAKINTELRAEIAELKTQLAQPEQEPVALVIDGVLVKYAFPKKYTGHLYTTPPQRPWVGLTDEEIEQGCKGSWVTEQAFQSAVWWAEARLKEKNNG